MFSSHLKIPVSIVSEENKVTTTESRFKLKRKFPRIEKAIFYIPSSDRKPRDYHRAHIEPCHRSLSYL